MSYSQKLPGTLHLLWMLFMQPIKLQKWLKDFEIDEPHVNLLELWRDRSEKRRYAQQMLLLMLVFVPGAIAALTWFISQNHPDKINLPSFFISLILSLIVGVGIGILGSLAVGLLLEINIALFGVIVAYQSLLPGGTTMASGIAIGLTVSMTIAIAYPLFTGIILDFFSLLILSVAIALVPYLAPLIVDLLNIADITADITKLRPMLVAFGMSLVVTSRILIYPFEAIISTALFLIQHRGQKFMRISTLRLSPIYWHELSYFRYPFLSAHIVLTAVQNRQLARQTIHRCRTLSIGQKQIAQTAITRLRASELVHQVNQRQFNQTMTLQGDWLPGTDDTHGILQAFQTIASYLNEAQNVSRPPRRFEYLDAAQKDLKALENKILGSQFPDASTFYSAR
ncbi:MAG: hypothetical protein AAGC54_00875 [Cyanobacteria bacterium P01_F01_bin.4]